MVINLYSPRVNQWTGCLPIKATGQYHVWQPLKASFALYTVSDYLSWESVLLFFLSLDNRLPVHRVTKPWMPHVITAHTASAHNRVQLFELRICGATVPLFSHRTSVCCTSGVRMCLLLLECCCVRNPGEGQEVRPLASLTVAPHLRVAANQQCTSGVL